MIGAGKCAQLSASPRPVPGRATATAGLDSRQVHVHFRQQGPCRARADRQRRSAVGLVFCAAGTQPPRPALPGPSAHLPIQTEIQAWVCGFACARCLSSRSCVCVSAGEHACACANVSSCECACSGACVDEWTVVIRATPPVAVTGVVGCGLGLAPLFVCLFVRLGRRQRCVGSFGVSARARVALLLRLQTRLWHSKPNSRYGVRGCALFIEGVRTLTHTHPHMHTHAFAHT